MPDSISSCGVLNAPPARITSRAREPCRRSPGAALGARVRRRRAARLSGTRRRSRGSHRRTAPASPARSARSCRRSGWPLATSSSRSRAPDPLVVPRRQRRVAQPDRSSRDDAPVVRIELALEARAPAASVTAELGCAARLRTDSRIAVAQIVVARRPRRRRLLGRQPAADQPWRLGLRADRAARRARRRGARQSSRRSKYVAHVLGAPRRIAGEVRELIPVGVVRVDEDHARCARCSRRACRRADTARRRSLSGDARTWDRAAAASSSL